MVYFEPREGFSKVMWRAPCSTSTPCTAEKFSAADPSFRRYRKPSAAGTQDPVDEAEYGAASVSPVPEQLSQPFVVDPSLCRAAHCNGR